jgi:hypothetical protein
MNAHGDLFQYILVLYARHSEIIPQGSYSVAGVVVERMPRE